MKDLIENKVMFFTRDNGRYPKHIVLSHDMFHKMKAEFNPMDGYFVPSQYKKDLEPDTLRGLIISLLTSNHIEDYLEVV